MLFIKKTLEELIASLKLDIKVPLSLSIHDDFHYQSSIFFKNSDSKFQEDIISKFNSLDIFSKIEKTGKGFLSLKINFEKLLQKQNTILIQTKPKNILVDYCGVNVAKQMHIGHIRSMFIGDYITKTHIANGDNVIIQNHIGDWGTQFGYLLQYIIENNLQFDNNKELTQIYKDSFKLFETDLEFKQRAIECSDKLYKQDPETIKLWKKTVNLSLIEAQKFFDLFNLQMTMDDTCGESFYQDKAQSVIDFLLEKKIATKDENGTVVVFFKETDLSPLVLQKSTGAFLYPTYDLAAIEYRTKNFNSLDKIIYVVDKRQALHFKQVFNIAIQAGWAKSEQLQHVGFGTILGADKKPLKTRSGQSLYLDDLLNDGLEQFHESIYWENLKSKGLENLSIDTKTVIGALKYYDLHIQPSEDYVFDWKHVLNILGNSAPYIQNTFARIDSILEKSNETIFSTDKLLNSQNQKEFTLNEFQSNIESIKFDTINFNKLNSTAEKLIFNNLLLIEELTNQSKFYQSNKLTEQLVKVANNLQSFYEKNHIIGNENQADLIKILKLTATNIFYSSINLGIELYPCVQKLESFKSQKIKP